MEIFGFLPIDAKAPMLRAIELARKCVAEPGKKTPSPKVGAVLVHKGKIIAEAYRGELAPGDHAEFTLLDSLVQLLKTQQVIEPVHPDLAQEFYQSPTSF